MPESTTESSWWKTGVVYQVYPRSFADSSGSGMGDLAGITSRLAYLKDLGVDALWLSPFYPSPQVDAGYDIADYRDVDPVFGSLEDFEVLLHTAHEQGLAVIIDLVPNHSSYQHPLFQAALRGLPEGPERAMYHFVEGDGASGELPPNNWKSVFGGPSWTRVVEADGQPGQWYYHLFDPTQPDFNWGNPRVLEFFEGVLRFWLDLGVDGFRIDVSDALIKDTAWPDTEGGWPVIPKDAASPVHDIYRHFRAVMDEYPETMAVIETGADDDIVALFLRPDEMHQAFNFRFLKTGWDGGEIARAIFESARAFADVGAATTWVTDNHDTVRSVTRYASGGSLSGAYVPQAAAAGAGIADPPGDDRPIVLPDSSSTPDAASDIGVRRARAMAVLLLSLPGSAYIYAGQELGLPEVTDLPDEVLTDPSFFRTNGAVRGRDGCRVPLPWSGSEPPFGFSPTGPGAPPPQTWLPQPDQWASLTVAQQADDPSSMLSLYRNLLRIRREEAALGSGALEWVSPVAEVERTGFLHLRLWAPQAAEPGGQTATGTVSQTTPTPTDPHALTQTTVDLVVNFTSAPVPLPHGLSRDRMLLSSAAHPGSARSTRPAQDNRAADSDVQLGGATQDGYLLPPESAALFRSPASRR